MGRMQRGETQVLVGTQLVAKGLDLPKVTLVGVILADIGLYLPDFRSGERAFSLLCQVAGRAGRGAAPGKVVVQTYTPRPLRYNRGGGAGLPGSMFEREVQSRRELGNPPFSQLAHLVHQHVNATHVPAPGRGHRQAASPPGLHRRTNRR